MSSRGVLVPIRIGRRYTLNRSLALCSPLDEGCSYTHPWTADRGRFAFDSGCRRGSHRVRKGHERKALKGRVFWRIDLTRDGGARGVDHSKHATCSFRRMGSWSIPAGKGPIHPAWLENAMGGRRYETDAIAIHVDIQGRGARASSVDALAHATPNAEPSRRSKRMEPRGTIQGGACCASIHIRTSRNSERVDEVQTLDQGVEYATEDWKCATQRSQMVTLSKRVCAWGTSHEACIPDTIAGHSLQRGKL